MALIIDPDNLSQGLETAVADAVFTASGAQATIDSSGANLPTISAGDFFEVRDHSTAGNNGLYVETGGTPTASQIVADKVDGVNPATAGSEAIRTLHDNGAATEEKSVMIDTGQKRIYLIEQGNLSTDGVTEQALYSFLKEEWKSDADLIQNAFPMISITPEQFEFSDGWEPRNVTSPAIQSKKLIRTGGWSEISTTDILTRQYMGVITLGTFEDEANDVAYYQLGDDPTDTSAAVDFTFAGAVNEAIQVYDDFGVPGDIVVTGTTTITSASSDFVAAGFAIGGQVTIQDSENSGENDGTFVLTDVTTNTLVTTGLTNNADDTTMRLAVDNRNAVKLFLRIRDGDPLGKTFDASDNSAVGFTTVDNKAFRFPLANVADTQITATDGQVAGSPWSEVRIRYLPETYNRDVDLTDTERAFGIVIDVGTYSRGNGASATSTLFTSADHTLGAGEALADYTGGTLRIHDGTDKGLHTISGTPVDNAGTLEITLTGALTATESNLSFTMDRASPLTADQNEIYEKVQFQLRQASDIDEGSGTVTGKTADAIMQFIASNDVRFGFPDTALPANPNGGGTGVIVEGFDTNDTNNFAFFDNTGTSRTFPFVAAGNILFNANLVDDSAGEFWMFFDRITRTTVSDLAISGASGSDASIDSTGANLPTVSLNDYFRLTDMTNPTNNGIWVVTDATPTTSQFDARKVDSLTVVNESAASHPFDFKPVDSPQAIIVDDNSGSDIVGPVAASVAFDFDYDNNVQGGRTAATDADILIRAIGLETGQFAEVTGTITRAVGLSFSVVSALERNYSNP